MPFHLGSLWGAMHVNANQKVCDRLKQNKTAMTSKKSGPVLSHLWTKVVKFLDNVGDPYYFSGPLADCLCQVPFRRFFAIKCQVVEKPYKCKSFLAPNFFAGRTTPTILQQIFSAIYRPPFGKVWLSSIC